MLPQYRLDDQLPPQPPKPWKEGDPGPKPNDKPEDKPETPASA
jgi:hypothetical protein